MKITIFSTFLAFMGIGVVDPLLPVIAAQIGAKHWEVEMLFTAYILTMAFIMIPAGIAAGKWGEKRVMTTGLFIVSAAAMFCALSNTIADLSAYRAVWGFGNAMFFATAMIMLIMLSPNVSSAIGSFEAAVGLGMAAGPLLGGVLGEISWRYPFAATSVLVFSAFLLTALFVKQPATPVKKRHGVTELVNLLKYTPFLLTALSAMAYYYGFFTILAYSPLLLHLSPMQLGFVFFGWGLLLAYGSAKLSHDLEKKVAPRTALAFSLAIFAIITITIFLIHNPMLQLALVVVSGLSCGLTNALFTTYIIEISPYERSITSSAYNFVRWLGAAVAPVAAGLISERAGASYPYLVAFGLILVAIILFVIPQVNEDTALDAD